MVHGILNLNKPVGQTSFAMVRLVRRLTGERRVGHGGTLDRPAQGVLPVFLGQATRVAEYLLLSSKDYRAEVELGIATDTYDATGSIVQRGDPSWVTRPRLEEALAAFRGPILQAPPPFSAVKRAGRRLWEWAREGTPVAALPRPVVVYRLELVSFEPPCAVLLVECGKGVYVRSLAHDLGQALGCGAHLQGLVRLRYGPFAVADALSPSALEAAVVQDAWEHLLYPLDAVLQAWPGVTLGRSEEALVREGQGLALALTGTRCRAYSAEGKLIALLRFRPETRLWSPEKVFSLPQAAFEGG